MTDDSQTGQIVLGDLQVPLDVSDIFSVFVLLHKAWLSTSHRIWTCQVDENGCLVGIISADDVMAQLSREMLDTCHALKGKGVPNLA